MFVMSNAYLSEAEVTQIDRWGYGPLEIHLVSEPSASELLAFGGRVLLWNQQQCAGFLRDAKSLDLLRSMELLGGKNPNLVMAPTHCGYSELLGMLGSLLPDEILQQNGIDRPNSNFWLWPFSEAIGLRSLETLRHCSREELDRLTDNHLSRLASIIPSAFEEWAWKRLVGSKRYGIRDFSKDFSLRILAGDVRFWMHRLYRVAIELYESFPPTDDDEEDWRSLEEIQVHLDRSINKSNRTSFRLNRPRIGGDLWDAKNPDDREWIGDLLVDGEATVASLEPVVGVLLGDNAPDDFSDRYSWIKEDFERTFYSKRSRVTVKLCEFVDEFPVHDGIDTPGYEDILFRDLMAFFNRRDRVIILALRQGMTRCEIAEQLGHSGHASITRRVKQIQRKMHRLLRDE